MPAWSAVRGHALYAAPIANQHNHVGDVAKGWWRRARRPSCLGPGAPPSKKRHTSPSGLGAHLTNDEFVLLASNRRQADEAEFVCVIVTASGRRIRPMFVGASALVASGQDQSTGRWAPLAVAACWCAGCGGAGRSLRSCRFSCHPLTPLVSWPQHAPSSVVRDGGGQNVPPTSVPVRPGKDRRAVADWAGGGRVLAGGLLRSPRLTIGGGRPLGGGGL